MTLLVAPRYLVAAVPKHRLQLTPSEIAVRSAQPALFLVDTQLRMLDKLVPFFRTEMRRRRLKWLAGRLEREIWRFSPEIYVLNSSPDLTRNLRVCLATHFRARGIALE